MVELRKLPSNVEAEECLIGCMLLSPNAVGRVIESNLSVGDFFDPCLAIWFDVIKDSYSVTGVVDEVLILEAVESRQLTDRLGGRRRLVELMGKPPSALNVESYLNIVLEHSALRSMIGAAEQITELGFQRNRDAADLIDEAESIIFNVAERKTKDTVFGSDIIAHEAYQHLGEIKDKKIASGIATGFREYDDLTLGLQNSSLYILAARPAMGKTAFALNMATNVARDTKLPVLFFSLEMSNLELMNRVISTTSRVPYRALQTANIDNTQFNELKGVVDEIASWPIYIDDDPNCTVLQMRAKARRLKAKQGQLGAIFVDYIQLMGTSSKAENRQVAISELSRGLKILARELDCPVIALSQLNRNLEYRSDKRPMLADLRESGSLEQDADVVTFLYRDEIYDEESEDKGICELIVGKNRRGATGRIRLAFIDNCVRFAEIPNHDKGYF